MTQSRAIAVVGAGNMGHGFALHFANHAQDVTLIDHRQSNLDRARTRITDALATLSDIAPEPIHPESVHDRITFTLDLESGVEDADIVLETVSEDREIKHDVFDAIGRAAPPDAVLATNTSQIPITDLAEPFSFADRMIGCHWWFPPYLLTPVEVVLGDQTADATLDRVTAFVRDVDRDPIIVNRDVPGFVWNRVQTAVFRECLHIVEEGVASIDDVNRAIRDGYATRTAAIGPFETIDIAGLELFQTVSRELNPHLSNTTDPSPLFDDYLEQGRGGIEDGAGFFEYDDPPATITRRRDERVMAIRRALDSLSPES